MDLAKPTTLRYTPVAQFEGVALGTVPHLEGAAGTDLGVEVDMFYSTKAIYQAPLRFSYNFDFVDPPDPPPPLLGILGVGGNTAFQHNFLS